MSLNVPSECFILVKHSYATLKNFMTSALFDSSLFLPSLGSNHKCDSNIKAFALRCIHTCRNLLYINRSGALRFCSRLWSIVNEPLDPSTVPMATTRLYVNFLVSSIFAFSISCTILRLYVPSRLRVSPKENVSWHQCC